MNFFTFGLGKTKINASAEVFGGKGAGLIWMAKEGVPVPPGFVIPIPVWEQYDKAPVATMAAIEATLPFYLGLLQAHFGYMPLLSVRSGSRVSCPGMMDTILNVGIDSNTADDWQQRLGPLCFADSLHRLVTMYGSVVEGLKREALGSDLKSALDGFETATGHKFPNATAQVLGAIEAVFKSWDNERALVYRKTNQIPREWGTAVTVQAMVFGNLNEKSGTGVLFTRNPDTGKPVVTGEFLPGVQGEDIVAGSSTPMNLDAMLTWNPPLHAELIQRAMALETARKDVQDIEFTIQDGTLYFLQIRHAKRSATAAIKIALDLVTETLIDAQTAINRVTIKQFDQAQTTHLDPKWTKKEAFKGISACSGVVTGKPVFSKEDAISCTEPCILVADETNPNDIAGMEAAVGVITMVGGFTSHAAVVARGMNRACIVGVGQSIDVFKEIDVLSLDGSTGQIWTEAVPIIKGESNGLIHRFSRLVTDTYKAVPIIFQAPTAMLPQALLYLGDQLLHPKEAANTITATLLKVDRLYLDLELPTEGAEADYFKLVAEWQPADQVMQQFVGTLSAAQFEAIKPRLFVRGYTGHPFQTVGADLRSLVMLDELWITEEGDHDPAVQKILAWRQHEGVPVVSLGIYKPDHKSFVSVPALLQLSKEGV